MTGRRDVDEFLARSEAMLTEPEPPAACAWCSHPLDDASPSRDFCGENCAWAWRTGMDWSPGHRCACRTCNPDGAHHRPRTDPLRTVWIDMMTDIRARAVARPSPARGLFQVRPEVYREQAETGTAVHRTVEDYLDLSRVGAVEGSAVAWAHYDEAGNLVVNADPETLTAESVLTEYFRDLSHDLPPAPMPPWLAESVTEPGDTRYHLDEVVTYETGERSP